MLATCGVRKSVIGHALPNHRRSYRRGSRRGTRAGTDSNGLRLGRRQGPEVRRGRERPAANAPAAVGARLRRRRQARAAHNNTAMLLVPEPSDQSVALSERRRSVKGERAVSRRATPSNAHSVRRDYHQTSRGGRGSAEGRQRGAQNIDEVAGSYTPRTAPSACRAAIGGAN